MPKGKASLLKDGLNERERTFVELYMGKHRGNATRSYAESHQTTNLGSAKTLGGRLLTKVPIRRAMEERVRKDPNVASRQELQQFFSSVSRGEGWYMGLKIRDRLRAAELLGRSHKMFGDVLDVNVFDHEKYLAGDDDEETD